MFYKQILLCLLILLAVPGSSLASVVKQSPVLSQMLENKKRTTPTPKQVETKEKQKEALQQKKEEKKEKKKEQKEIKKEEKALLKEKSNDPRIKGYLKIVDEGLTSLEEDSWSDAVTKTTKQMEFFEDEFAKYPNDQGVAAFLQLSIAFHKFCKAGSILDSEDPDFDEAKYFYLGAQLATHQAKTFGKKEKLGPQFSNYVGIVDKYIREELGYVNKTLKNEK